MGCGCRKGKRFQMPASKPPSTRASQSPKEEPKK